jgi:hypothetical protein
MNAQPELFDDAPFNLVIDDAVDGARQSAEKRAADEARQRQDEAQTLMFGDE